MEFTGKVALVTGAGSGIGEASARALAANGATVAALDITPGEVGDVCKSIAASGDTAFPLIADVSNEAQMRAAMDALIAKAGRLDFIVVNAGINGVWAPIEDIQPAEWDKTIAVNLRGTYLTLHLGVPHLKAAGGGAIVMISSINGTRSFSGGGSSAYTATKAGQAAMANVLALELGRHRIRVNTVAPGSVKTNIGRNTERRRMEETRVPIEFPEGDVPITGGLPASPSDIADAVRFLCSEQSKHINGTWLHVDGGQSLLR